MIHNLLEKFFGALNSNTTLKVFDFSYILYGINYEGVEIIANTLCKNISLLQLYLNSNFIYHYNDLDNIFTSICNMMKYNRTLQVLELKHNTINESGSVSIAEMLSTNNSLLELNLSCTSLGNNNGIANITRSLMFNCTLRSIDLSNNCINETDTNLIVEMLTVNKTLLQLNLANNLIGKGILSIAKSLTNNETLSSIDLSNNLNRYDKYETVNIIEATIELLNFNNSLTNIQIGFNHEYHNNIDNKIKNIITRNKLYLENMRFVKIKPVQLSFNELTD